MKINTKNWEKLNDELAKINGRADAHTFTGPQLKKLGVRIKNHLSRWFTQAEMRGITGTSKSGDKMPNAYQHSRVINVVTWEVGAGGNVFITGIEKTGAWREEGKTQIAFTDEQREIILKKSMIDAAEL